MFNVDAKVLARIARRVERVLLVDPNVAATYLLADIMKGLGAKRCAQAASTQRAFELCIEMQPQLIFCEVAGPNLDGAAFTSRLRRSALPARAAPVVVVSADTREPSIRQARDSGAHEFLLKPFTAAGVFKRVQAVMLKPRPWVETDRYVGPDRRRFNSGGWSGRPRRQADLASEAASAEETFLSAETEIRTALAEELAVPGAVRKMIEQTFRLQKAARTGAEEGLALTEAIEAFQRYLVSGVEQESLDAVEALTHLDRIGALRHVALAVAQATMSAGRPQTAEVLF